MANKILILGESGTGKSTSTVNLDEKQTYIIQCKKKDLPYRGWKKRFFKDEKNEDGKVIKEGNIAVCNSSSSIIGYLNAISLKRPNIKVAIIDDFQYLMSGEFMNRAFERGFDKFTEIAKHAYDVLECVDNLRDDLTVVFLSHIEVDKFGREKIKTIGNLLDDKITIEGLFTTVLKSNCSDGNYYFETQNNGNNTVKSPMEMFNEKEPNDLKVILEKIKLYNEGE